MRQKYNRILIINTFGIGDVLFSTPMVRALKQNIPDAGIDFLCNERCQRLLENNKNIDTVIVFEKDDFRSAFKKSKIVFLKMLLDFLIKIKRKRYDLAIDLSLGYQISLVLKLFGVKKRIGFNYHNRGRFLTDKLNISGFDRKHVVEHYLDILNMLDVKNLEDRQLELVSPGEADRWADNFIQKNGLKGKEVISLAPGGGKSWGKYAVYRRWNPDNFSYIAQELSKKSDNISFLLIGSKDEKHLCRSIRENLGERCLDLCGELPLMYTIAIIKKCNLLLCNDGGILHIAVSQGVNTISIFGPVDDKVYGPYPPSARHAVVKAENVECRPCYGGFKHRMCETHRCLDGIDKKRVLEIVKAALGRPEEIYK